jgi:elongation factor 3
LSGAGKSTLIKLLTGEIVPTSGKVKQHPNLRVGYIKQHALEHLKMHLERTPSQYIQWRYAYGEDREVHYKQTRLLSEADRARLERSVDIGDRYGPMQIEALVGRQKHLKSFKYEVYVLSTDFHPLRSGL